MHTMLIRTEGSIVGGKADTGMLAVAFSRGELYYLSPNKAWHELTSGVINANLEDVSSTASQ